MPVTHSIGQIEGYVTSSVVFQPGGTASGNIYTTFSTAWAALQETSGPRFLYLDARLAAVTIPAGTYDLRDIVLSGVPGPTTGYGGTIRNTVASLADGVIFQNLVNIRYLDLSITNTTTPVFTHLSGLAQVEFDSLTLSANAGTKPFIRVDDGATLSILCKESYFPTVAYEIFVAGVSSAINLLADQYTWIESNTVRSDDGTAVGYFELWDASSEISLTQANYTGSGLTIDDVYDSSLTRICKTNKVSFPDDPANTNYDYLIIPTGWRLHKICVRHQDPTGAPAIPTAGDLTIQKDADDVLTTQLDGNGPIDLDKLDGYNTALFITAAAGIDSAAANTASALTATTANRVYTADNQLCRVSAINLNCNTGAELHVFGICVREPLV